jgi:hypothetical protein
VTDFGGDAQHLDAEDIDKPPEGGPAAGPIKAWSAPGTASAYYHGMQSVQLKTTGRTHKAVCLKFYGSDPENPSKARLELTQHRKILGGFDFDAPPEIKFYIENDEIQVLKAFLAGQFLPADGYYVRVDSREMAAEVANLSAENLGDVLAAISDKTHMVEAIQASGHADFLADYVINENKRLEIGHLETAVWEPGTGEAVFQRILERNPWMFGGQYVATGERTMVLGDQFDVPLVTADGSLHLIELKRADATPIIRRDHGHWILGAPVHEAVSQTQNYLRGLDEDRHRIKSEFGIDPRRLHATVVMGHIDQATSQIPMEAVYETLRTYNSHMTRITVMTYDQLVTNARNAIDMPGYVPADDTEDEPPDSEYDNDEDPWAAYDGLGPDEVAEEEEPYI